MKKLAPLMDEAAEDELSLDLGQGPAGGRYDVKSDGFPEKFVGDCSEYFAHKTFTNFISYIKLTGSTIREGLDLNGHFKKYDDYAFWLKDLSNGGKKAVQFDGVSHNVSIRRRSKEEGWTIVFRRTTDNVETLGYKVKYSGNLPLPPSRGWVSAHPLARGILDLTYYSNVKELRV